MGPPPFGSGNRHVRPLLEGALSVASMGPPPFGSGNAAHVQSVTGRGAFWRSFNGATAFRQWKRFRALQCPVTFRRSFNGATAFRQWKPFALSLGCNVFHDGVASMGPPPFGSGNAREWPAFAEQEKALQWGHRLSAVETWKTQMPCEPCVRCFNGATAFRQWKPLFVL